MPFPSSRLAISCLRDQRFFSYIFIRRRRANFFSVMLEGACAQIRFALAGSASTMQLFHNQCSGNYHKVYFGAHNKVTIAMFERVTFSL